MALTQIQTSLKGRQIGLSASGALVINKTNGYQLLLDETGAYATTPGGVTTSISGTGGGAAAFVDLTDKVSASIATINTSVSTALAGKQATDADLTAIAALTSAADKLPYSTGTATWSLADFTAAGRALIDDATAAAQLTTLGVSGFIQTLIDDVSATAARATLGLVIDTDVVGLRAPVSLTSTNTLIQATHFNRHCSWTGSSTAAQALSATATAGDFVEVTNDGTAVITFTGITPLMGFKAEAQPGETFMAVYSNAAWVSLTPNSHYMLPQNSKSAAYTTVLTDAGKHLYHPGADTTARTWTIDSNANVAYPIGTAITFVNDTLGGVISIAISADTLVLAGAGTTGTRSLAASGVATAIKMTSTRWIISGTGLT